MIRSCLTCMSLFTFFASLMVSAATAQQAEGPAPTIWIEAEQYDTTNFADHWEVSSMGRPQLLSGGQWLMRGVSAEEVKSLVPNDGVHLQYSVAVTKPGTYRLWARVGWFRSRADFQWRLGDGPWKTFAHDEPTTNLMELGFFTEASWADLGDVSLNANTTLDVRWPKVQDEKSRMLMALDCFAFVQGDFLPDGPFKPGETYDSEADRAAAQHVFQLPRPTGDGRSTLDLTGPWQVARFDDPNMDENTYEPVRAYPKGPFRWMAFQVPGDPWKYPPLIFGHRLVYRTKVAVPKEVEGRGFHLHFSGTNWIVSVFVNGQLAGTHRGVWVPWDLDISSLLRPGTINELMVVVKGTYYAMDAEGMGGQSIHAMRNRPLDRKRWTRWVAPIYPSVKGDGDGYIYGIVNPVTLVVTGDAYTEDVFVKPSVERKSLTLDYTFRNTSDRPRSATVIAEAVHDGTGTVERTWDFAIQLAPRATATVTARDLAWEDPKLWWPKPNPDLYRLRTTLRENGRVVDVHEQTFGFREVTIRGTGLYINGVRRNFWNWVDVKPSSIERPEDWANAWRREGDRFMRFSHGRRISQVLPTREQRLDFYDRQGIPGRLCTMIDGMFISYRLLIRERQGDERIVRLNEPVWENFREHMEQVAKAYRNHPSVILYQAENELVYINGMNIYGGDLELIEQAMADVIEAGRRYDPTRPYTVGGGGDLSGRLEINAPHYPTAPMDWYPENAYTIEHYAPKIERWPWDRTKPWQVGECSFANELSYGTLVLGSRASRSKQEARRGKARYLRMLYGGYRWAGVSAFFPWDNLSEFPDAQKIFSDLCVIPRKQTKRFFGGRTNELLVKIMNDALSNQPLHFSWSYEAGGREIAQDDVVLQIEPGFGKEHTIRVTAPQVTDRVAGVLTLKVTQEGSPDFHDQWAVPVLPSEISLSAEEPIWLYDRSGQLAPWLEAAGRSFTSVGALAETRAKSGLLLIGPDTLTANEAFGTDLLAFAIRGGRVICLEQAVPPAGIALPTPLRMTEHFGGYAHPAALGTPLFDDLGPDDLIDWTGDHPTYKAVYEKPVQGARALAVAGPSLQYAPLIEVPCGAGVIVLSQLRVGAKLVRDPAAGILLRNMINVYQSYRPPSGVAAIYAPNNELLYRKVAETGVMLTKTDSLASALDAQKFRVAVIQATPEVLGQLNELADQAAAFQQAGGWIMLCNLTAAGIDNFNQLVGGRFLWRPMRMEKITLHHSDHPLAATLSDGDLALYSPEQIMHTTYWVSANTFNGMIDAVSDFAPFTLPPGAPDEPAAYQPTRDDHDPYNFVNGLMADESWRYTRQIWVNEDNTIDDLVFRVRKPEMLAALTIWNLDTYGTINEMDVLVDNEANKVATIRLPDATEPVTLRLPEPVRVERTIILRPRQWTLKGRRNREGQEIRLVGINNVAFFRAAEPDGAVALDSAGALVALPRSRGGWFVNQIKFLENEPKLFNEQQKQRIFATLLANMGIGFRTAAEIAVPGVNVRFQPLNLQEYGNTYLDNRRGEKAWFGDPPQVDLSVLPRGTQTLGDVTFHITDYATAPTPDVIILGGNERRWNPPNVRGLPERVENIRVGRKADVLYFLHTAHVSGPITDRERAQMLDTRRPFSLPEVMQYILHYEDGQTATIPVVLERQIDHWIQETPRPLAEARIAWSRPLDGLERKSAVLYTMEAKNPRPEVTIRSIELVRTSPRAVPAIVGITLGTILTSN